MCHFVKLAAAGALSVVLAGPNWVSAQQGAGAGAQAPGVGVRAQGTASAQMGINQTPWFSNPQIRAHIGLNEQAFNQLNTSYGQAYTKYNSGVSTLGNNFTPEQRMQRMQDLQNKFNQDFNQSIQTSITDPMQRTRYNQLYLQYQGYGAFNDPQVQQKLNLTAAQQQQLQQYAQQYNQQLHTLQQNTQTNPQLANQQFNDLRQKSMQNLNSILNAQQQQTWRQLTGEPYNFQWNHYYSPAGVQQNGTQQPGR
ncbi:MAG TPA: hypothetical protein VNX28_02700 [Gemmataceae bacterium]|jgi:hypothetical protein|nr:hypothetical protein [Gemmataceae bacterium]